MPLSVPGVGGRRLRSGDTGAAGWPRADFQSWKRGTEVPVIRASRVCVAVIAFDVTALAGPH